MRTAMDGLRFGWMQAVVLAVLAAMGPAQSPGASPFAIPQPSDVDSMEPAVVEVLGRMIALAQADSLSAEAIGRLGTFYRANFLNELSLPCYRRATELAPDEARWHHLTGLVAAETGLAEAAERSFLRVLELSGEYPAALFGLGEVLFETGRTEEAAAYYERLSAVSPESAAGRYGLGRVAYRRKDYSRAAEVLTEADRRSHGSKKVAHLLGLALRRIARKTGDAALERRARRRLESARGEDSVRLVADRWSESLGELAVTASVVERRAAALIAERRFDEASALYAEVVRRHPDNWAFLLEFARVRFAQDKKAEAAALCERATEVAPGNAQAWAGLAEIRYAQGDHSEALRAAERAVILSPSEAQYAYLCGRILLDSGRTERSAEVFGQVLELEPNHAGAAVRLADALNRLKRPDQALRAARRAVELGARDTYARFELAVALDLTGDVAGAREALRAVLSLDPSSRSARRYLDWIENRPREQPGEDRNHRAENREN